MCSGSTGVSFRPFGRFILGRWPVSPKKGGAATPKAARAEQAALKSGSHPEDLLPQITEASQADSEAHKQLARMEKELLVLLELASLPEPDPNPQRAAKTIQSAAEDQSLVILML